MRGKGSVIVTTYLCVGYFAEILYHYNCKVNESGGISLSSKMIILTLSYAQEALEKRFIVCYTVVITARFKLEKQINVFLDPPMPSSLHGDFRYI